MNLLLNSDIVNLMLKPKGGGGDKSQILLLL